MTVNESPFDRVIRGILGVILIVAGLLGVQGGWGVVLAVLGAASLFTAVSGHCTVYRLLGINTAKKG